MILSTNELEALAEFTYIPHICFSKAKYFLSAHKRCKKAPLEKKAYFLGKYYQKEIENDLTPDVTLKWLDYKREYGLFTNQDLMPHQYVGAYCGEIRKYLYRLDDKNAYLFEYKIGNRKTPFTINAMDKGNLLRFVNHSDEPNLTPIAVVCHGLVHIILRTSKKIPKGSELTYDYGPAYWAKRENPLPVVSFS